MRSLTLVLLVVLTLGCWPGEEPYRHYDTHEQAVAAGELQRGWLPVWVPAAASDIHLQGDLDTNQVWLRFSLPSAAGNELRSTLRALSDAEVRRVPWPRPVMAGTWWPRNLVLQVPADDIALNAEFFETLGGQREQSFIVGFERGTSEVFAWSKHA